MPPARQDCRLLAGLTFDIPRSLARKFLSVDKHSGPMRMWVRIHLEGLLILLDCLVVPALKVKYVSGACDLSGKRIKRLGAPYLVSFPIVHRPQI